MIVYNAEPNDYSSEAILQWDKSGYTYVEGSWHELEAGLSLAHEVKVLIVRLGRPVTEAVLNGLPNLSYVISATTGHDHLNTEALEARGIQLISLRGHEQFLRTIPSTAELTWGLLLDIVRNITKSILSVKTGHWDRERFKGFQLQGKTIGIVGLGRVGTLVAKYAEAFGMRIVYTDPHVQHPTYERISTLEQLAGVSDVLSVHVHLNEETEQLINADVLSKLPTGSILLNTSRGKILDEEAVLSSLKAGKLRGVAVDVVETELVDFKQSVLWKHMDDFNILITPHIGGASFDAMWSCELYTQKQLLEHVNLH